MEKLKKAMIGCKEFGEAPFPPVTLCEMYDRHKRKYSDYNILGQTLRLGCQLAKTDFDNTESVKHLKRVTEDSARILKELSEE